MQIIEFIGFIAICTKKDKLNNMHGINRIWGGSLSATLYRLFPLPSHPRIDPLVHHVGAEIHQHVRQPNRQQASLHQRVIAVRDRATLRQLPIEPSFAFPVLVTLVP